MSTKTRELRDMGTLHPELCIRFWLISRSVNVPSPALRFYNYNGYGRRRVFHMFKTEKLTNLLSTFHYLYITNLLCR